ncbi:phosphonate C-P lyase system protein PhnG [Rhodoplanes roseus]|uniref:Phosphonate C-P lyase system protein PhnG n=1 Tax=Rhodoplanes roseus TaxID=29409 RepID=A0A327L1E3_9BRAD|nr:phosphonate C-P lyase system protein PhnG [Rhodoplanes roseus]RAI44910.1 phosphonate C-P lyase system protein PhnG [Rhodoplanes roseus]
MPDRDARPISEPRPSVAGSAPIVARRRAAMTVLVDASAPDIAARLGALSVPPHETVRPPEVGLVMVQGRIGGDGAPFNVGEATVTRAAVRLASGEMGVSCVLGRDPEKARLVALCDAMMQADLAPAVEQEVVAPLRANLLEAQMLCESRTAATRVDFFTLVRGED